MYVHTHMLIIIIYKGDTGLRGSIGEPGMKGSKGDQGTYTHTNSVHTYVHTCMLFVNGFPCAHAHMHVRNSIYVCGSLFCKSSDIQFV